MMSDDDLVDYQISRRGVTDTSCRTAYFAPRCKNPDCHREWHGLPVKSTTKPCPGSTQFEDRQ